MIKVTQADRFMSLIKERQMTVAAAGRLVRERSGETIKEAHVKHLATGKRPFTIDTAETIGSIFGVRPAWLIWGELPKYPLKPAVAARIERVSNLPPHLQEVVDATIDSAIKQVPGIDRFVP